MCSKPGHLIILSSISHLYIFFPHFLTPASLKSFLSLLSVSSEEEIDLIKRFWIVMSKGKDVLDWNGFIYGLNAFASSRSQILFQMYSTDRRDTKILEKSMFIVCMYVCMYIGVYIYRCVYI